MIEMSEKLDFAQDVLRVEGVIEGVRNLREHAGERMCVREYFFSLPS
jgi:hypothetical protein